MIEKHFGKNPASIVFDPIPSYGGDWFFTIDNLRRNAKFENGINLWDEFYRKTYLEPIEKIFRTSLISDIKVGMVSKPNVNNFGRCLQYSKVDFFSELVNFLNQNIDNYGLNDEEKKMRIDGLINHIKDSNENLNIVYSDAFKEKMKKLKDLMDKEFNSDYFEAAMQDYAPFKSLVSFTDYIKSLYEKSSLYQMGLLRMGDFFDRNIDFNELYTLFDPDKFFLLFAKIIYELNIQNDKVENNLQSNHLYLIYYKGALDEIYRENTNYNPVAVYLNNGEEIRYSSWEFLNELDLLIERYPKIKEVKIPTFDDSDKERYKDISLMDKLAVLTSDEVKVNWKFLSSEEMIKKGDNKDNLSSAVNMRISILENSGFISRPLQGLNTFMGYYAFIYPNGIVILEKFWNEIDAINPSLDSATFIISIDEFIELSKKSGISIIEYMKTLPSVKRVFHTSVNNWQRNLYDEINGKYRLEDAINFINNIQSEEVKHDK